MYISIYIRIISIRMYIVLVCSLYYVLQPIDDAQLGGGAGAALL